MSNYIYVIRLIFRMNLKIIGMNNTHINQQRQHLQIILNVYVKNV